MAVPTYYEIVANGVPCLLPAQAVVANVDRREAEMISDEKNRPVGWLTLAYRRVPIFLLPEGVPGRHREWTRALVIQTDGGEPIGLAVEALRAVEPGEAIPAEISVPGNRIPGGGLFAQALIEGERIRLILDPERLSRRLHALPRL